MLFQKVIVVHFEKHTKHLHTLYRQNAEFFTVTAGSKLLCKIKKTGRRRREKMEKKIRLQSWRKRRR
jgi:hypothetical protein